MRAGFVTGMLAGAVIALAAMALAPSGLVNMDDTSTWVQQNLGHSVWLFAAVLIAFFWQLNQLQTLLQQAAQQPGQAYTDEISRLDQLLDVWIQSFVGIGVIWTAVGMRSALQAALSDPSSALTDTAGNVLRDLVDGGILLALSTTILGAVGGYLMRLLKTALVGAQLQAYFAAQDNRQVAALRAATERIEQYLKAQRDVPNGAQQ